MKILCVQKASGIGGSERHLLSLLPGLAARGVDVRMCVLATGDAQVFVDALEDVGIATSQLAAGPDANPALVARLVNQIRRAGPDVVHTHLVHADVHGLPAARVARVRAVSTIHGAPNFYRREPYRSLGRVAGRMAHARIAISEHVAAMVRELHLAPAHRLHVVHYGIDPAPWRLPAEDVARARARLDLAEDDVAVGVASRLIPGKGHDLLLEAVDEALPRAGNLKVLVAGAGPSREDLERSAAARRNPERIRFLGFVPDMPAFMSACDVVAFPSTPEIGEGFGLAILEAMAVGRPVVATASGPVPEIVVDGETGILVPPGTRDPWVDALVRLAGDVDERRRLGAAASRRAVAAFGIDAMLERTLGVYESVLRKKC